jgi:hypothetical protein
MLVTVDKRDNRMIKTEKDEEHGDGTVEQRAELT